MPKVSHVRQRLFGAVMGECGGIRSVSGGLQHTDQHNGTYLGTVVREPRSTTPKCHIFVDKDWPRGYWKLVFGTVLGVPTDQRDIGLFQPSSIAQRSFVFMSHSLCVTAIHLSPAMSAHPPNSDSLGTEGARARRPQPILDVHNNLAFLTGIKRRREV